MHARLTKTLVDRVSPPEGQQPDFYRDTSLNGFALRVTPKGVKSFIVETRVNGRVRRKTLGRYGPLTVEQARKQAQQFLGEVAGGADPISDAKVEADRQVTLGEAFEAYLSVRKDLKASTVHDYRRHLRESFRDWLDRPLASIGKEAIAKRHEQLGERSPARANNAMRVLRAVFNFAKGRYEDPEGNSLFPENPVDRLSRTGDWYRVERRRTLIARSDLPAWFEAVASLKAETGQRQGQTVADLLFLLIFTGLRRSEGMGLRWDAVDLADRTLTVHETKNREPLTLPLPAFLYELLAARAAEATSPFVFPGLDGASPIREPRPQMRKVAERSGVSFTLHDLRRTFVTVAESLDIPYYALKQLVNHKISGDVTAGYIVTNVERLREPMQRISDSLLDAAGYSSSHLVAAAAKAAGDTGR